MKGFIRAARVGELKPGEMRLVEVEDERILLANVNGAYHAVAELCTHSGGPLSEGFLEGEEVECPWHGSRFNVVTGAASSPPAVEALKRYAVRVDKGQVLIRLPEGSSREVAPLPARGAAELRERVAIVTGGETGIGKAIATALAREGADVVIAGLGEESGRSAARAIEALGRRATFVRANVTAAAEVSAMARKALEDFGRIDILVNNAGIQHVSPIVDLKEEDWDRVVDVHLKGTFLCARAVLPAMISRKWGRIINISSAHGKIASPFKAPYVAAKHGVIGFTKVLALETAEHHITANCICPGYVLTPLVERQLKDQARLHGLTEGEVAQKVLLKDTAQKRFIEDQEVAALAAYLSSEAARGITGQAISLDGGWVMQ